MGSLLPAQPRFGRRRRPESTTLHSFADVRFERAAIVREVR
jgi:hypothetical protein